MRSHVKRRPGVLDLLVVDLCDAEVVLVLKLLDEALDAEQLDGGEEYVATQLYLLLHNGLSQLERR